MGGVLVDQGDLRRIGRGIKAIEALPPPRDPLAHPAEQRVIDRSQGLIRAVLCEPLYGHGSAIAVVSRRRRFERMIDVQVMGRVTSDTETFQLQCNGGPASDPIAVRSTAAEAQTALIPWGYATGSVFVSHGGFVPEAIPRTLRPTASERYVLARWTLAFVGPEFARVTPVVTCIASQLQGRSIAICHRSAWEATTRFVEVFEAGLLPDEITVQYYSASRFFIPGGTAIIAGQCADAGGLICVAAETRKYQGRT